MNIDINIELLKTFFIVAKYKNITKASNELLVSQSTVSKSIKNIEEQLDCQLFTKQQNRDVPAPALPHTKPLEKERR